MMEENIIPEDELRILEEGIARARHIFNGYPINALFSGEDFMKNYNSAYNLCLSRNRLFAVQLYARYKRALQESIISVVLPSLIDKQDVPWLIELIQMWEYYKTMTKCLSGFFLYLDNHYVNYYKVPSLKEASFNCFCDMVYNDHFDKIRNVAISMINMERNGILLDFATLENAFNFIIEFGVKRNSYYENFEQALLADATSYYSRLASEWLSCDSFANYMLKVDLCLKKEIKLCAYLRQSTREQLIQIVKWQLVGQNESKLLEKQKAESFDSATYQDMVSKCSSMKLEDQICVPPF